MIYDFNGKKIKMDDTYLEKNMRILGITKEEAIQQFLEDEGYLENAEQQALMEKTKGMRLHENGKGTKERKKREAVKKVDPTKKAIIDYLFHALNEISDIQVSPEVKVDNLVIENDQKLISFTVGDESFTLDLVKHNKKKKAKNVD